MAELLELIAKNIKCKYPRKVIYCRFHHFDNYIAYV